MSTKRKIVYAALTVLLLASMVEGVARLIWWRLELRATRLHMDHGQAALRNDAINFMKVADGLYGYRLKEGWVWPGGGDSINAQGFHQTENVAIEKTPGTVRVACLGESTTFGSSLSSNYPMFLQRILRANAKGQSSYEVINAGVPGWVSGQVALRAEHDVARYKPDAAILYVGWNDFQCFNPLLVPPVLPAFQAMYGGILWKHYTADKSKTVAILSAAWDWWRRRHEVHDPSKYVATRDPAQQYRFLVESLDDIVNSLRRANPDVKIFVCTLVGVWPEGTAEQWKKIPSIWWVMDQHLTPTQTGQLVDEMNGQIREFARTRGAYLIDAAAAFAPLDRVRMQFDFAHMYEDGYELLAWNMYDAFRKAGVVQGQPGAREEELRNKYLLAAEGAGKQ